MSLLIFNGLLVTLDIDTTNLYSMEETDSKVCVFLARAPSVNFRLKTCFACRCCHVSCDYAKGLGERVRG